MNVVQDIKIHLLAWWFLFAVTALFTTSLALIYISRVKIVEPTSQNFRLYAALPSGITESSDTIVKKDARALIIENFFAKHKAPLADYGDVFIEVADKYHLDYRLLPSIAMQESNGGKRVIKESYNPFGYGIYGSKVTRFENWEQAIERVGRGLREDYLNEGLTTPATIMTKYTPPSAATDGAWAKGVSTFFEEML